MTASTAGLRREARERPLGTRNEVITGPVSDWATDFSHLEPEWAADPYPIQDDLRQRCPIAHTERFGGAWLPTRYEDVAAIAYDTEHFSSRSIIVSNFRPPRELAPVGGIAADLLRPAVPPRRAQTAAAGVHQERGRQAGSGDAERSATRSSTRSRDRTSSTPPATTPSTSRCGSSPTCSASRPRTGRSSVSSSRTRSRASTCRPRSASPGSHELFDYLLAQIRDHVDNPRDDLTTYLIDAELYGQQARPVPRGGHDGAAAHRRHRHDLERDRRVTVAPGEDPRRPRAPGRRARAAADRDGGVPPGLRARSRWPGWSRRTCTGTAST